jgi:hypothetical protein
MTTGTTIPTTMPEVVKEATALNGTGAVVVTAWANGLPSNAERD